MKNKTKIQYRCRSCLTTFSKWLGQCSTCQTWDSLEEEISKNEHISADKHWAKKDRPKPLLDIAYEEKQSKFNTNIEELDRTLGGGVAQGSCILLGGDPGIGKSTLLLQMLASLDENIKSLYISGEESQNQVGMRAKRLGLKHRNCLIMAENRLNEILNVMLDLNAQVIIIDSIQTLYDDNIPSSSGSVAQIRECTHQLIRFCKSRDISLFIIGHVTKDGSLAGPRVLEHMVDTVLYFEGDKSSRYRMVRTIKNRFGPANEVGIFIMTNSGLKSINNPSKIFLQDGPMTSGRVITALWEGSRSVLVEIQVLLSTCYGEHPRRVAVGFDINRLHLLLAVISRHLKIKLHEYDIFVNVVGGIKIQETSADAALIAAILACEIDLILPNSLIIFGEVGLGGEIRPIPEGQARIQEGIKQGFNKIIIPKRNHMDHPAIFAISDIKALYTILKKLR